MFINHIGAYILPKYTAKNKWNKMPQAVTELVTSLFSKLNWTEKSVY